VTILDLVLLSTQQTHYNDRCPVKEYLPDEDDESGGSTLVVVSLVLEIQGDSTK
jgi:hypothetical protein